MRTFDIVNKANRIVAQCETRDPFCIAKALGINVWEEPLEQQRGAYKVILRQRYIFLNQNLDPVMKNIVLLHEIGHDIV